MASCFMMDEVDIILPLTGVVTKIRSLVIIIVFFNLYFGLADMESKISLLEVSWLQVGQ